MKLDLSNYTFQELIYLKEHLDSEIYAYSDGYEYICEVRSYGRNWLENVNNPYILQELCYRYNGDDGIIDVYSTNPSLDIQNYGDTKYIKSKNDYKIWKEYSSLVHTIPMLEKEWEEWDDRENIPFKQRPYFEPIYSKEEIEKMKQKLKDFDMSFEFPVAYKKDDSDIMID